jgi:carbamate kinase
MRIVVALGGNALLQRGEEMTSLNQRHNIADACAGLAPIAAEHELVISHGNGPQVGLLALQGAAYDTVPTYPLDVLGAETQGMIGYLISQEMGNRLPFDHAIACLLTMIEVDPNDPAFDDPTKPIGPMYTQAQADELHAERGWSFKPDGASIRRVVASPRPKQIFELRQIRWLLEHRALVICAGGGGIPTAYDEHHHLVGVEAVIDKDHASELLATGLGADLFIMATDTDAAYVGWGTPDARRITRAHPDALIERLDEFAVGSMRPKIEAACNFARQSGKCAVIGSHTDLAHLARGEHGTVVSTDQPGLELATPHQPAQQPAQQPEGRRR